MTHPATSQNYHSEVAHRSGHAEVHSRRWRHVMHHCNGLPFTANRATPAPQAPTNPPRTSTKLPPTRPVRVPLRRPNLATYA
jgi:hypothetical protein